MLFKFALFLTGHFGDLRLVKEVFLEITVDSNVIKKSADANLKSPNVTQRNKGIQYGSNFENFKFIFIIFKALISQFRFC